MKGLPSILLPLLRKTSTTAAPLRSTVDLNCAVVNAPSIASISAVQQLREDEQVLRAAPERKESESRWLLRVGNKGGGGAKLRDFCLLIAVGASSRNLALDSVLKTAISTISIEKTFQSAFQCRRFCPPRASLFSGEGHC